jgi:magnesium transporter
MVGRERTTESQKAGLPPGSLVFLGEKSENTRLSVIDYDMERMETRDLTSVEEAFPFKATPTVTWLNITGLQDVDILQKIGQEYHLHPLIIEDILNTGQRPKAEIFDTYIFLVFKMVRFKEDNGELDIEQVSMVLGENFVITFQEKKGDVLDPLRKRIAEGMGRIRKAGPDYLAYAIADIIVDQYFAVLEALGEAAEQLEEAVISNPEQRLVADLYRMKRHFMKLRRSIWPLREELSSLIREEHQLIHKDTIPFLRDLYDHTIRIIDTVEALRDMVTGLLDVYLSSLSNRMNEVMKVLTIIATIFIPLTFIAGVYGMNFQYMPELKIWWAYPIVWIVFLVVAAGMVAYFRSKKWL